MVVLVKNATRQGGGNLGFGVGGRHGVVVAVGRADPGGGEGYRAARGGRNGAPAGRPGRRDGTYCKRLPAAMAVRFVVGLALLCGHAYRWAVPPPPDGGDGDVGDPVPGRPTFAEARKRLGLRAMARLCRRVVRPLADPASVPGGFYRGLRLMAIDGFVLDVPDSAENDRGVRPARVGPGQERVPAGPRAGAVRGGHARVLAAVGQPFDCAQGCAVGESTTP